MGGAVKGASEQFDFRAGGRWGFAEPFALAWQTSELGKAITRRLLHGGGGARLATGKSGVTADVTEKGWHGFVMRLPDFSSFGY